MTKKGAPFYHNPGLYVASATASPASRALLIIYSLSMFSSAMPAPLFFFYVRDVLGAEPYLTHFLALYIAPGLAALPLWNRAAARFGASRSWLWAMVFTAVVFVNVCIFKQGDLIPYAIICVLSGLTFGAEFFLPARALKECMTRMGDKEKVLASYSAVIFLGKVTAVLGCAPLVLFTGPLALPATQQPLALLLFYGFIPALVKLVAAYVLWSWLKTNGGHDEKPDARGGYDGA